MLPARALQPFESLVLVPAIRVHFGDLVCRGFRKILGQLRERGICLRDFFLAPACACYDEERAYSPASPSVALAAYLGRLTPESGHVRCD